MNYTFSGFSKAGNAVVRGAIAAAQDMGHTYVGTEHLLLALARENSFTIVEDDCFGDLTFDGCPRQALRGLDDGDTVLYLNSFSKSLVPGLRLGYLLVPGRFEKRLILAKFNADIASPALLQEMLALYLQRGLYAAHLERLVAQ